MFGDNSKIELLIKRSAQGAFSFEGEHLNSTSFENTKDILIFKSMVKQSFCESLINFFKQSSEWRKSVTYGEMNNQIQPENSPRQSDQIFLAHHKEIDDRIYKVFNAGLEAMKKEYLYLDAENDEGYNLLRYSVGGEYKEHVDHGKVNNRVVSGLIYLNGDYIGGELYFPRFDLTIKPEVGMLVLFPSGYTHIHSSLPILSGTKYAVVTWFK